MRSFRRYAARIAMAVTVVATMVSLATPALLWAHARLTRSDPSAKATSAAAPKAIRLWFSEAPEIAMTRIVLTDSSGRSIPLGAVESGDGKLVVQARVLTELLSGQYTVSWHVAGVDGHPSSGSYHVFRARQQGAGGHHPQPSVRYDCRDLDCSPGRLHAGSRDPGASAKGR